MKIQEVSTSVHVSVTVVKATHRDFSILTEEQFSFRWSELRHSTVVYKLLLADTSKILGAVSLIEWPKESRIEIKLLAASMENVGNNQQYRGIGGCLISFACQVALRKYGSVACVSLLPKTGLITHYMNKYRMKNAGKQLYLDGYDLIRMINEYQ